MEASLYESRQQSLIADKRIELTQNDNIRLTRELAQYKEKANHILAMKERVRLFHLSKILTDKYICE